MDWLHLTANQIKLHRCNLQSASLSTVFVVCECKLRQDKIKSCFMVYYVSLHVKFTRRTNELSFRIIKRRASNARGRFIIRRQSVVWLFVFRLLLKIIEVTFLFHLAI